MKNNKKTDKAFVAIISIVAGIAVFVVLAIVLWDPIVALVELKNVEKFNTENDIISVVYTEPLVSGDQAFSNKQIVLSDSDADEISLDVELLLKNVKYSKTNTDIVVEWNKNIVLYSDTDTRTIYLGEQSIYMRKGKAVIQYTVDDDHIDAYNELLSQFN